MRRTPDILHGKILIVDDQEADVRLLERTLSRAGYDAITSTTNPREVRELHREHRYDLILLDLLMPDMDGFQVMEGLRELEPVGYLPVLVITAEPEHKARALQAGALDLVGKPFELAEVLARVHNMLEMRLLQKELQNYSTVLEQRVRERTAANKKLRVANEQLAVANRLVEEATQAKSGFLASMSHELRTPLNSILGFSGVLLQGLAGPLNPEQRKQVGMINISGKHLLGLISEVLDIAKIESGRMDIEVSDVELDELVERVTETVRPLAEQKSLMLAADRDQGCTLHTDGTRVEQILLNLLANAIKFTETGTVRLEAHRSGDFVAFKVEDTGSGIAPEDMPRVFEEFFQGPPNGNQVALGTGLGLPVAKRLTEMLGGTIEVESEVGSGSTFLVTLPLVLRGD